MTKQLSILDFLEAAKNIPIADVRSPAEFEHSHIDNAFNLPLFTNEERAIVGTTFKQEGREPAILKGFELIGPRWADYIRIAESHCPNKKILVHCWRGGMRSAAMAWALSLYGFEVGLLQKGYKAYRQYCLSLLEVEYSFIVLGGYTGSAKTETLHELQKLGEQVIDLEKIANHQGSSFGSKGSLIQPSQEQFENELGIALSGMNLSKKIWIENESVLIGKRVIPTSIFRQMNEAPVIHLQIEQEARIDFLYSVYGLLDKDFLKTAVINISRRLGPNETKLTLQAIDDNRLKDFIRLTLVYYDKTYSHGLQKRPAEKVYMLLGEEVNPSTNAKNIIHFYSNLLHPHE
jgi:tRNA 2-selenouridine synthase